MVMTGFFFPDENLSVIKLGVSCFGQIFFHYADVVNTKGH